MIRTVRADQLRAGDIMSTNGARIESAVLCQDVRGLLSDEVCICYSFEADGDLPSEQRFEYVTPDTAVHLWTPDLTCPDCGEPVWDLPDGHKFAKCWNTDGHADGETLAFDTMDDDDDA